MKPSSTCYLDYSKWSYIPMPFQGWPTTRNITSLELGLTIQPRSLNSMIQLSTPHPWLFFFKTTWKRGYIQLPFLTARYRFQAHLVEETIYETSYKSLTFLDWKFWILIMELFTDCLNYNLLCISLLPSHPNLGPGRIIFQKKLTKIRYSYTLLYDTSNKWA